MQTVWRPKLTLSGQNFEKDVRRIARLLWSEAQFGGAQIVDDRERDGVFETRDAVHVVECTISRSRDKAVEDAKKTAELVQKYRKTSRKHVNGWLVTRDEPTADQRTAIQRFEHSVRILGFEQFRSQLFNGAEYLRCRVPYRFGSVADPITKAAITDAKIIPIDLFNEAAQTAINQDSYIQGLITGSVTRTVLLGEYGSGKSMTLRNFFFRCNDAYLRNTSHVVPVYLNLRDHTGQSEPVEALERHARIIGYPGSSSDLVRAWRGGLVNLLLDGFDEMATTGWGGSLQKVQAHRFSGMTLVRRFVSESPSNTSIIVAGRHNFFDSTKEMAKSLGVERGFQILYTQDFSEAQAREFLSLLGIASPLPDWMPRRPLLLAYLAGRGFLQASAAKQSVDLGPAEGWDHLLAMICEREAQQDSRLDPTTVRLIIERLATIARSTEDGRGRIDILTIQNTFRDVAGFPPDDAAQQFILRLPALGPSSLEDSSREFVDPQIADAARAGDVIRYVEHPYASAANAFESVVCPLGEIAINIVSNKISAQTIKPAIFLNALNVACNPDINSQLAMDLANILTRSPEVALVDKAIIRAAVCDYLLIDDFSRKFSNLIFQDCLFNTCEISRDVHPDNLPQFEKCVFGTLDGFFGGSDLPMNFRDCDVSSFVLGGNTAAQILHLDIPEGLKILLTVLRKLFLQPGSGRQEAAFYRGALDSRAERIVPEVLNLIARFSIAEKSRYRGLDLWRPNRTETFRVRQILAAPMTSPDPLVKAAREL
ncbi:hypothetical protein KMZ29_06270 [Bradyrhizobium sediminis]|uniref:NACHT domain-containing protein n=1 Tax=Bradyrhizobium sediminis TaxID=2840469 RepID=A0A975NGS5_9BRAD|nr:hypothetical protein [Bradyrhizobium sediminis]QWG14286.1 hypothetical protein KMZ29_06270 [Bradyrhizobium sediminis]